MKTKIILVALMATFAITLFSSCTDGDCGLDEGVKPTVDASATK